MRNWQSFFTYIRGQGFDPVTIIDVGVATDTNELYQHFPKAKYLFVEPCEEFESALMQLCHRYPGSTYMLAAAGAINGETVIHVTPDLGGSSRFVTVESQDGAYDMIPRTVPQFRIDTLWQALELKGPALLKIDVQGGELEVIRGAAKVIDNFEVIVLECGLVEQYLGQPIFHEYIAELARLGFVIYDIIHTGYSDTGLLCQIDLVCVKKSGQFRTDQRAMTDYSRVNDNYKGVVRSPA
tara:strand:+ start:548 stop:1264 length:717 start_codon:yes stop_codon:yes gene_type:complete